jgi:hypothetical protein
MAKTTKRQPWTKDDVRTLKMLAREKTKTTVIARKLKRTERATYQKAAALGVMLGEVEEEESDEKAGGVGGRKKPWHSVRRYVCVT